MSEKIYEKRIKFKEWHYSKRTERGNSAFSEYVGKKEKTVVKTQQQKKKSLGEKLNSKEKQKLNFGVATQIAQERRDIIGINCLRNKDGSVVVDPESVKKKWKEYMKQLMNVENTWNGAVEADLIEVPIECITEMEVENALSAIKLGKALGPKGVSSKMLFAAGRKGKKL